MVALVGTALAVTFGAVPLNVVRGIGVPGFEAAKRSRAGDWKSHYIKLSHCTNTLIINEPGHAKQ